MWSMPDPAAATRRSPRRTTVLDAVGEGDTFRSAQEVHHDLRANGDKVGLSTVYRNLQALASEGELDSLRNEEGEVLYRRCSTQHHHHLMCRSCGRVVEISGPTVERWAARAADEHGFRDVSHTLELFGTCADCAR
jgi:Fur family ferric uptake transcriptional regulator